MHRAPIKVCVRTRPTPSFAHGAINIDQEAQTIVVKKRGGDENELVDATAGTHDHHQNSFRFQFHHILHNAAQESLYELARDVVQGALDGSNGTIMSTGQTGSGKSFTMIGDTSSYQHRGVVPRALSHVFQDVAARRETAFNITVTYMEIYNEKIFDLLLDPALEDGTAHGELTIAEEKGGRGTFVRGLTSVQVQSEKDALNLLYSGELMRTTAQHNLNRCSNRSHCIMTLHITQRARSGVSEKVISSKLHLVDLAGSERLKKALDLERLEGRGSDTTIRKESMYINQSLSYLEQCVVALSKKPPAAHVPYRQTKLTNVLKDSLGGNSNTLLFACIWGEETHLEETLGTLRLASRMMRVQNETHATEALDPARLLRRQEQVIRDLRQELLMSDALAERGSSVQYDPYTAEQQEALLRQLERYMLAAGSDAEDAALPALDSVRQMKELCRLFKGLLTEAREEASRAAELAAAAVDAAAGTAGGSSLSRGDGRGSDRSLLSTEGVAYVGKPESRGGFSIGRAPDNACPSVPVGSRAGTAGGRTGSSGGRSTANAPARSTDATAGAVLPSPASTATAAGSGAAAAAQSRSTAALSRPASTSPAARAPQADSLLHTLSDVEVDVTAGSGGDAAWGEDSSSSLQALLRSQAAAAGRMASTMSAEERGKLFQTFRDSTDEGAAVCKNIRAGKDRAKELRSEVRSAAAQVNAAKLAIDELQNAIEAKQARGAADNGAAAYAAITAAAATPGECVMDEEEFRLVKRERQAKKAYKAAYDELRALRLGADEAQSHVDTLKLELLSRFDEWAAGQHAYTDSARAGALPQQSQQQQQQQQQQRGSAWDSSAGRLDQLDENEMFETMELERVKSQDPEALAFFQAMKMAQATRSQNSLALRQMHRSKRNKQ